MQEPKSNTQRFGTESSWDIESIPRFGQRNKKYFFFVGCVEKNYIIKIYIDNESDLKSDMIFPGDDSLLNTVNQKEVHEPVKQGGDNRPKKNFSMEKILKSSFHIHV